MIRVNLIPKGRLERQRVRRRSWFWISAVGMYTAFLAVAFVVSSAVGKNDDRAVRSDLVQVRSSVASSELSLSTLQKELDQAAALYFANLEVGSQPDWSVLLALLAKTTGDEVVLRSCRMRSVERARETSDDDSAPTRRGPRETDVEVGVTGVGRSQEHVTDFLLRMEDIELFKDVKLQDTRREPFLDGYAVAFSIDFALDAAGGSK